MIPPRAPVPGTRLGIAVAVRALPTRTDRDRCYPEFVAELCGQPASSQFRHTAGVLARAFALRAALGGTSTFPEEARMTSFGRRFRCHVLRWHGWRVHSTEDGGLYKSCSVCQRDHQGELEVPHSFGKP